MNDPDDHNNYDIEDVSAGLQGLPEFTNEDILQLLNNSKEFRDFAIPLFRESIQKSDATSIVKDLLSHYKENSDDCEDDTEADVPLQMFGSSFGAEYDGTGLRAAYSRKYPKDTKPNRCNDIRKKIIFSDYQTHTLKKWFDDHIDQPFPDPEEKEKLATQLGLTVEQIKNWFTNNRKRYWDKEKHFVDDKKEIKKWFDDHIDKPFPNPEEKEELATQTGLTVEQIKNWFINKRKRTQI